jgi:hypothetical protein
MEMKDIKAGKKAFKEADNAEPYKKKAKTEEGSIFKKESVQKVIVNGTYQGLEDVLVAKHENKCTPTVLFACNELSVLFNALEKDPAFESIFLMLYTAKVMCGLLFLVIGWSNLKKNKVHLCFKKLSNFNF